MAEGKKYRLKRRRRREGRTDYRQRLELLKSNEKRLVTRIKSKTVIAQIVEYHPEGDNTIASAVSQDLRDYGYEGNLSNTPAAYLTGILIGKRALDEGIQKAMLDIGLHTPKENSRVFAVLKGALEAGLEVPHSEEVLPEDERTEGESIEDYRDVELNIDEIASSIKEGE